TEDVALPVACVFDDFSKLHIVKNFHSEALVGSDRLIYITPDHVERTDSHVIVGTGIGDLPWPVSEHEEGLKEGDHHFFASGLHDNPWEHDEMIGLRCFGVGERPPERIGLKQDIAVREYQPNAGRLLPCRPHRVGLPQPAGRKLTNMEYP